MMIYTLLALVLGFLGQPEKANSQPSTIATLNFVSPEAAFNELTDIFDNETQVASLEQIINMNGNNDCTTYAVGKPPQSSIQANFKIISTKTVQLFNQLLKYDGKDWGEVTRDGFVLRALAPQTLIVKTWNDGAVYAYVVCNMKSQVPLDTNSALFLKLNWTSFRKENGKVAIKEDAAKDFTRRVSEFWDPCGIKVEFGH